MQRIFTLIIVSIFFQSASGQVFQEVSCGTGYNRQSYIKLADGSQKQVNNDAWDLAFTAFGFQDAGIFINESAGSSMGQNLPQTELYDAKTSDFNATIVLDSIIANKYLNSEASWNYGAFNETRDLTSPFDYGWGKYNPAGMRVDGIKVFVLKLRNGNYKKIKIESLTGTTYNLKYANLDGTDEVTKAINKAPVSLTKIIYFSFTTNDIVDVSPASGFDLMYGRYTALAKDPNGTVEQQYNVTGILNGPGVKVAAAIGVNPASVKADDFSDKYSTRADVIGHDWKTLVGAGWELAKDRAYFVQTADKRVWKLVIIDFEGSATGIAVFEKTDLGRVSNHELTDVATGIAPNPISDQVYITLETSDINNKNLNVEIIDQTGRMVEKINTGTFTGFNVLSINSSAWKSGLYLVRISNDKNETSTLKVVKL